MVYMDYCCTYIIYIRNIIQIVDVFTGIIPYYSGYITVSQVFDQT